MTLNTVLHIYFLSSWQFYFGFNDLYFPPKESKHTLFIFLFLFIFYVTSTCKILDIVSSRSSGRVSPPIGFNGLMWLLLAFGLIWIAISFFLSLCKQKPLPSLLRNKSFWLHWLLILILDSYKVIIINEFWCGEWLGLIKYFDRIMSNNFVNHKWKWSWMLI